jgi:hypothetical protein
MMEEQIKEGAKSQWQILIKNWKKN